jgi:ABC-type phosphate transport system auxiliary subunit
LPAKTKSGVDAVLRARSACDVAAVTVSVAVAEAAPPVWLAALTVAVSVIMVPVGVPAITL